MLHNIDEVYRCEFETKEPEFDRDYLLFFSGEKILLKHDDNGYTVPKFADFYESAEKVEKDKVRYLFQISGISFFLYLDECPEFGGMTYERTRVIETIEPKWLAFGAATAFHLGYWYQHNRYCGVCGAAYEPGTTERSLVCPKCGYTKYPDMSVAIIAAVTNGDNILLTKYAGRGTTNYALVAGFNEIGESLEDTVRREVMEEAGLKVKNIRYYGNQPWGFSRALMAGFVAELDGSPEITVDTNELSEAIWVKREDMPSRPNLHSLTATMMNDFHTGKIK